MTAPTRRTVTAPRCRPWPVLSAVLPSPPSAHWFSLVPASSAQNQQTQWASILQRPQRTLIVLVEINSKEHGKERHFIVVNTATRTVALTPARHVGYTPSDAINEEAARKYFNGINITRPVHAYELRVHVRHVRHLPHISGDIIKYNKQAAGGTDASEDAAIELSSLRRKRRKRKQQEKAGAEGTAPYA